MIVQAVQNRTVCRVRPICVMVCLVSSTNACDVLFGVDLCKDRPNFSLGNVGAINITLIFDLGLLRPTAAIGHRFGGKLKLDNCFRDLVLPLPLPRS